MLSQDDDAIRIARTVRELHDLLHGPDAPHLSDDDRRLVQDLIGKLEGLLGDA